MRGLDHLSFGEFVGFLARSPATEAGAPPVAVEELAVGQEAVPEPVPVQEPTEPAPVEAKEAAAPPAASDEAAAPPAALDEAASNSFTVPGWWNDLSTPIRNAGSLSNFKQQLKTHLFQLYLTT